MQYRVYAPCARTGNTNTQGAIINVGGGWGNDVNAQRSHTARVRVTAGPDSPPSFDSGWIDAAASTSVSYWAFNHSLGGTPARVRVLAKAVSGLDRGFVYDGVGGTLSDDDQVRTVVVSLGSCRRHADVPNKNLVAWCQRSWNTGAFTVDGLVFTDVVCFFIRPPHVCRRTYRGRIH